MTLERTQKGKGSTRLSEIKKHNDIDNLIFRGYYSPGFSDPSFGFSNQVLHQSGKPLVYPESNIPIDGLFANSTGLIPGQEYLFEAEIAIPKERKKRQNPYLLKAKDFRARALVKVIENQKDIYEGEVKIVELQRKISELNEQLEDGKKNIQTQVNQLKKEEEAKLAVVLEAIQLNITHKEQELTEQSRVVQETLELFHKTENQLVELEDQKTAMENTITFLKQKIAVCQNLEFLSEKDINKYLHTLGDEPFSPGEQYLDFEQDFQLNYSVLAEHIQHFLYHKKNLIYTKFQIENFLALLMTHDLIVLSGLSGSGKTQIVKAFA